MYRALHDRYPYAHCELDFTTPLELLVATILSAQTTDVGVNKVTPIVFAKYRTAADYAAADRTELETIIQPTGFFRAKADSLIKLGQALVERFDGEVPGRMKDLVTLPGVGRKTANVVLGNAFNVPGITVDTHFGRLVRRFGWTDETDAVKVEHAVGALFMRRDWTMLSHVVIFHGRRVCHARTPACGACTLAPMCPSYGTGPTEAAPAAKLLKGPRARELAALGGPSELAREGVVRALDAADRLGVAVLRARLRRRHPCQRCETQLRRHPAAIGRLLEIAREPLPHDHLRSCGGAYIRRWGHWEAPFAVRAPLPPSQAYERADLSATRR